jgi:hypothetical protein
VPLPRSQPDGPVTLLLRPESLRLGEGVEALPCRAQGTVIDTVFLGLSAKLRLRLDGGSEVLARIPLRPSAPPLPGDGESVTVGFSPEDVHVVPRA